MTTKEKLQSQLVANGMFEQDAETVMQLAMPQLDAVVPNYKITWHRPADEYPAPIFALWWAQLKHIALAWIEEHQPQAWFKPMFQ